MTIYGMNKKAWVLTTWKQAFTSVYSISHRLHRENGMYFVILTDLYRFIVEMTYFVLLLLYF